jgi:4-amino-4-deoxy-L-arabinose transferase-like glycosyltransferase
MQPPLVYVLAAPLLDNRIDVALAVRELGRAMFPLYANPRKEGGGPAIAYHVHGLRMFTTDGSLEPLRVLRSTSLVFGLLTVILTFAAIWRLSRDARFALLGGGLLAFNPQFLYCSGYFSNDPAAAAIGAAALWVVVRALEDAGRAPLRRHYVVGAFVIALGVLTKNSTLPGLGAAAVTLVAIDPRVRREVMTDTGIAAALVWCSRVPT